MKREFYVIPLNLTQLLVHTGQKDVCNTVAAVYCGNKKLLIIRPEYQKCEFEIALAISEATGVSLFGDEAEVIYGDAFRIDTWDNKIRDYEPKKQLA